MMKKWRGCLNKWKVSAEIKQQSEEPLKKGNGETRMGNFTKWECS